MTTPKEPRDDVQGGPRIVRTPRWNERGGSGLPPPGGQDEDRRGGRGNQVVSVADGPPLPPPLAGDRPQGE